MTGDGVPCCSIVVSAAPCPWHAHLNCVAVSRACCVTAVLNCCITAYALPLCYKPAPGRHLMPNQHQTHALSIPRCQGAVWSCVLNDEALLAATGSADFSARVWDAATGDEKHQFQHSHIVRCVAFAHRFPRLLTGCNDKQIRIFDLERPDAAPETMDGAASSSVRCAAWLQDDALVMTAHGEEAGLKLWDTRARRQVGSLATASPVTSIDVTFDGRCVTTADNTTIRVWDARSLAPLRTLEVPCAVESASYCPLNGTIAAGGEDMWVHLFDYTSGAELQCNKGHHGPVHTVRFCPLGDFFASGSEDGTIRIWSVEGSDAAAGP